MHPSYRVPTPIRLSFHQGLDLQSIKSHQWRILTCSAMTGQNLVEGLDWVVTDIASRLYYSTVSHS